MTSEHVIVWDLETVPDIAGYAAANGLTGKSDEEIREALGNKFPKHIYHSIVCIGALVAHKERDRWAVDAIGAPLIYLPLFGRSTLNKEKSVKPAPYRKRFHPRRQLDRPRSPGSLD